MNFPQWLAVALLAVLSVVVVLMILTNAGERTITGKKREPK